MKRTKKVVIDIANIKKDISLFFTSEEAKVLKKDVAQWGLTAGAIAAIMSLGAPAARAVSTEDGANPKDQSLGHNDVVVQQHTSVAVYNETCRCGGHSSTVIPSAHADSVQNVTG